MSLRQDHDIRLAAPHPHAWRSPWRLLLAALGSRLAAGRLAIVTPSGARLGFEGTQPGPAATLLMRRWRALRRVLLGGDVGFAEAYMDGDWHSPDLTSLIELVARNEDALGNSARGLAPLRALNRLRHLRRDNTRRGSRRNIAAHYDLGNDFYALWLDPSMTYSAARFDLAGSSLEAAQMAKIDRAAEALGLAGGERVLEIGCGWGAMAEKLAGRFGCAVTALTLSREQRDYAAARLERAGLGRKAEITLRDYRDETGTYDRIVSIEMLEAVGERHWPAYFRALYDRLKPGGTAAIQVITIADQRFEAYRRGADFIQRYIFPGGMLPSPKAMLREIAAAGLRCAALETFGASYALTLAEWRRRFERAWDEIARLGFDARFKRMWEYYLAYCEAGFRSGAIDVGLYRIEKPAV